MRGSSGRFVLAGALVLVVGACTASAETTTTPSSTTAPSATTSTVATTTIPETTTTVLETTTTTLLAGNWAEVPLIVATFGALGWWDGSEWVQVEEDTVLPVEGGEDYQVALFGDPGKVTGSSQKSFCDFTFAHPGVDLEDSDELRPVPGGSAVAISAPWELTPHLVRGVPDNGTYSDFAKPLLASLGLVVDRPVVRQVIRFDLEGDGVEEVVVVADDHPIGGGPGDYTLVFLRKIIAGEVTTTIVDSHISDRSSDDTNDPPYENNEPAEYGAWNTVTGVADLNGDGRMELAISGGAWESWWVAVWEYADDDTGFVNRIGVGCGV